MSAGRLDYISGTEIRFSPWNGNRLPIHGADATIPAAGVSLAPTGLTIGTVYYIYAYLNAGVLTLEASETGRDTDPATGVEIKTGDPTRTLVGMARPTTGGVWIDGGQSTDVRSWFNRRAKALSATYTTNQTMSSIPYAEISSQMRLHFLAWGNYDLLPVVVIWQTQVSCNTLGTLVRSVFGWEGGAQFPPVNHRQSVAAGNSFAHACLAGVYPAEGWSYFQLFGANVSASVSTYYANASRLWLQVVG
jgi:hypothetical protein